MAANYLVSQAGAEEVVAEADRLGGEASALRGDVAHEDDVETLIAGTLDRFGRLDILVNNAGILASDDAGYLTGQILHPSGGWVTG